MKIKISQVINDSIVDGSGVRLAVFTQGCIHNCPSCHNPKTHDINGGKETDTEKIAKLLADNPLLDGVTLTGGDPFMQAEQCAQIAKDAHSLGLNVWTYTGYTYEQLLDKNDPHFNALMDNTDVLIDGRFILEQRSLELKFRGSKNQRVIDLNKTRETGNIVELYK
ncbi:MAG: anaerobic ribonucleoside-triphosphate reductase activating protein [Lachnospiraceae bacterium]|nr:anaerobic ribonucleoside-triphosphate reductase activating protein [Lachnospiraceae bacterium]